MFETLASHRDNTRPGRFFGSFRRRLATRLGPPRGFDQARAELVRIARGLVRFADMVRPSFLLDDRIEVFENRMDVDRYLQRTRDRLARHNRAAELADAANAAAAAAAPDINQIRTIAKKLHHFLCGILDGGYGELDAEFAATVSLLQSLESDLAQLDRIAVTPQQQPRPRESVCRAAPVRTMLRCRSSHARRTRRPAAKKTAATSTGDPDPEPPGDARARLRSVALLIEAANSTLHSLLGRPNVTRDALFEELPVSTIAFLHSGGAL